MTTIDQCLSGVIRLGFDTSPIIYFVEAHPHYDRVITDIFQRINSGMLTGYTSMITLSEVLVQPLRMNNQILVDEYRSLLLESDHLYSLEIDKQIAELAAELRARYQIRIPDAIQVAAAVTSNCDALLANDQNLKRVSEIRILHLDDLL